MQTIKTLLDKTEESNADPYNALLQNCTTALSGLAYSPMQLLFSRMLRKKLLTSAATLKPEQPSYKVELDACQNRQSQLYDRQLHKLSELKPVHVRHNNEWQPAIVCSKHTPP